MTVLQFRDDHSSTSSAMSSPKLEDEKLLPGPHTSLETQSDWAGTGFIAPIGRISFAPALEGFRGFAVSCVLVSHVIPNKEMVGTFGVGIFFVLSGFLITGILVATIEKNRQARSASLGTAREGRIASLRQRYDFLARFYMDRFVRLTAALVFMVGGVSLVATRAGRWPSLLVPDALAALFYVHNWYPLQDDKRLMLPGLFLNCWSLAIEEQFYIVWALLIPFIESSSLRRRFGIMLMLTSLTFFIRYQSGYAFLGPHMYGIDYRYAWSANVWKMFLGCSARLLPIPTFMMKKTTGVLCTLCLLVSPYLWGWVIYGHFDFRTDGAWLELFTSFLVLGAILGSLKGNPLLDNPPFRFVGRISYALYLWQFPLQAFYDWPIYNWGPTGMAFLLAIFSTFVIEEPLRAKYNELKKARK